MIKNEVVFVSGQRGSGKTHWVQKFILGLSRFLLYDTLGEYEGAPRYTDIDSFLTACEGAGSGFFEAIFDPLGDEDFPFFCRIALAMGDIYAIVEEIDQFTTPFQTSIELQELIKRGRHENVNLIGVSRRPSEVSRLFTSQATRFILFRQIEPRDLAYWKSIIGEYADRLATLEPFDFFDLDFSKGPLPVGLSPSILPA